MLRRLGNCWGFPALFPEEVTALSMLSVLCTGALLPGCSLIPGERGTGRLKEDQAGDSFSLGKVEEHAVSRCLPWAGQHIPAGGKEMWGLAGEGLRSGRVRVRGGSGGQGAATGECMGQCPGPGDRGRWGGARSSVGRASLGLFSPHFSSLGALAPLGGEAAFALSGQEGCLEASPSSGGEGLISHVAGIWP